MLVTRFVPIVVVMDEMVLIIISVMTVVIIVIVVTTGVIVVIAGVVGEEIESGQIVEFFLLMLIQLLLMIDEGHVYVDLADWLVWWCVFVFCECFRDEVRNEMSIKLIQNKKLLQSSCWTE